MLKYSSTDFKIYSPHTPFSYFKLVLLTITHRCRELLDSININIDIARVIANPYQLIQHASNLQYSDACKSIISNIEPA
jgi:hypothetical protein